MLVLFFLLLGFSQEPDLEPLGPSYADLDEGVSCRHGVGLTGGLARSRRSWGFPESRVRGVGSPVLSSVCEFNGIGIHPYIGADFAPMVRTSWIGSDDKHRLWMAVIAGTMVYSEPDLRAGPMVSVGWRRVGAGARVQYLPFRNGTAPTGFDFRAEAAYIDGLEFRVTALVNFRMGGT